MSTLAKWTGAFLLLAAVIAVANVARGVWTEVSPDFTTSDGEHNVIEGLTGKMAVDQFLEVKDKRSTFNLPTIRTGLMMYQTQHGRMPRTLEEAVQSGDLPDSAARDENGVMFQLNVSERDVYLKGAGADRIHNTTDDVKYELNL